MQSNKYTPLTKENDGYYNNRASRQSTKNKRKQLNYIIISIALLIIFMISVIVSIYLSSLLRIARDNHKYKLTISNDLIKDLNVIDYERQNKASDINDFNVSKMFSETAFHTKKEELNKLKLEREALIYKLNKLYEFKQRPPIKADDDNPSSLIITKEQKAQLEEWAKGIFGTSCYNSARDGLNAKIFHSNCDRYEGTVTIIATSNGQIFGGYTSRNWDGRLYKYDETAFLYSFNMRKIYRIKPESVAIIAYPELLPSFGLNDIVMSDKEQSISERLLSFSGDSKSYEINNGGKYLEIKALEVFEIRESQSN